MDNIRTIKVGNIYYNKLEFPAENRVSQICLEVKNVVSDDNSIPVYKSIVYRYALMDNDNITYDTQDFVLKLLGIKLTPFILESIGFCTSTDTLPGIDISSHFVLYSNSFDLFDAIVLVEVDGAYRLAELKKDNSFTYQLIGKNLRFIHELQDMIFALRHKHLRLKLEEVNHNFLMEQYIEDHLSTLISCLKTIGIVRLDQLLKCLNSADNYYTMHDLRLLVNYGYRKNIFRQPYIADNAFVELN